MIKASKLGSMGPVDNSEVGSSGNKTAVGRTSAQKGGSPKAFVEPSGHVVCVLLGFRENQNVIEAHKHKWTQIVFQNIID